MKKSITKQQLNAMEKEFRKNKANIIAMNAVVKNGIIESAENSKVINELPHTYSVNIETDEITDQNKSGRCWMFAALNIMRLNVMKKLNIEKFELSQSYPLFWDKLEKSNLFLENILETLSMEIDSREIAFLLKDPLGDGGQWDMFSGIVEKYGVVPKQFMPESHASSATNHLHKYLTLKLREFACRIRGDYGKGTSIDELRKQKEEMLSTIYRMLCISLGEPPKSFTLEVKDKDNKFVRLEKTSPQDFYKNYVGINLEDYVSIINAPTKDKPYYNTYTVQYLGSVIDGTEVKYLNLPIDSLKRMAIAQLKDGKSVWFGSDVGQFSQMKRGVMALKALDIEGLFDTEFTLNKAERLDYGESLMTHAMVLCGVNLDAEGKPNRWRVENSWGDKVGEKGYFVMSDDWFDQFTYQVVIDKKYLTKEEKEMLKKPPIVLKPWDPMGSLAK